MTIPAIAPLAGSLPGAATLSPSTGVSQVLGHAQSAGIGEAFESLVQQLQSVNASLTASVPAANALALGHTDQLETVLLNMERTRVQFDFLMSVRNRLLESYQELMRMQV